MPYHDRRMTLGPWRQYFRGLLIFSWFFNQVKTIILYFSWLVYVLVFLILQKRKERLKSIKNLYEYTNSRRELDQVEQICIQYSYVFIIWNSMVDLRELMWILNFDCSIQVLLLWHVCWHRILTNGP